MQQLISRHPDDPLGVQWRLCFQKPYSVSPQQKPSIVVDENWGITWRQKTRCNRIGVPYLSQAVPRSLPRHPIWVIDSQTEDSPYCNRFYIKQVTSSVYTSFQALKPTELPTGSYLCQCWNCFLSKMSRCSWGERVLREEIFQRYYL